MVNEVWGTFAVNDHCRSNAFVTDLLLYDRLVVPIPADGKERDRWRRPDARRPEVTWDPDRLDRLLEILGTQDEPSRDGTRLAWTVSWSEEKWQYERSRLETTGVVSDDAFYDTRRIVADDAEVPAVVDAVCAYPSAAACVEELELRVGEGERPEQGEVAAVIARPLLVPQIDEDADFSALRETVRLATDEKYREARRAYHDWLREFFRPLQEANREIDDASLALAREKLAEMMALEREAVSRFERRRVWEWTKHAFAIIGLGAGFAAAAPALAAPGLVAGAAGILGWIAGRVVAPPPDRPPLTGASMFVTAERETDWLPG